MTTLLAFPAPSGAWKSHLLPSQHVPLERKACYTDRQLESEALPARQPLQPATVATLVLWELHKGNPATFPHGLHLPWLGREGGARTPLTSVLAKMAVEARGWAVGEDGRFTWPKATVGERRPNARTCHPSSWTCCSVEKIY